VHAVDGVSFTVRSGKVLGVIGPNGAGKTTLIDALTGFVRLTQGDITLNGKTIVRLSPHMRFRVGISRSFSRSSCTKTSTSTRTCSWRGSPGTPQLT